jgi:hypothetical protein
LAASGQLEQADLERAYDHLTKIIAPEVHGSILCEARSKLAELMDHMLDQHARMTPSARGLIAANYAYALHKCAPAELNHQNLDHLDELTQHDLGPQGDIVLSNLLDTLLAKELMRLEVQTRWWRSSSGSHPREGPRGCQRKGRPMPLERCTPLRTR